MLCSALVLVCPCVSVAAGMVYLAMYVCPNHTTMPTRRAAALAMRPSCAGAQLTSRLPLAPAAGLGPPLAARQAGVVRACQQHSVLAAARRMCLYDREAACLCQSYVQGKCFAMQLHGGRRATEWASVSGLDTDLPQPMQDVGSCCNQVQYQCQHSLWSIA